MAGHLIPDDVWQRIEPLLPKRPPRPKGGRPVIADRDVLTGIVFMLKTGISWEDLPPEMGCGCGMTCLRRLHEWQRAGIWNEIKEILQTHLREANRIDWSRARSRFESSHDLCPTGSSHGGAPRTPRADHPSAGLTADDKPQGFFVPGRRSH